MILWKLSGKYPISIAHQQFQQNMSPKGGMILPIKKFRTLL
jgi:hypothetical protein